MSVGESSDIKRADIMRVIDAERERGERYWKPIHEDILADRLFHGGDHYDEPDRDPSDRSPSSFRFVGQETSNITRHKSAQLTAVPRIIEARPADDSATPDDAEVAVSILENETGHPQKMFDDYCDMLAVSAISARIGLIGIDYDPDLGRDGEILFRPMDAAKIMWEPGYHDPHDLRCDWLYEKRVMSYAAVMAMRKAKGISKAVLDSIKPEKGVAANRGTASGAQPSHDDEKTGENQLSDPVTVELWWFKNDRTTAARERKKDGTRLAPEDRYMVCGTPAEQGCGWRSDAQGMDGPQMPEDTQDGCPECQGPTMRVDLKVPVDELLVYPKGKRLVMVLPHQAAREPLYDGAWPTLAINPKRDVRTFPVYVLTDYLPADPTQPCGPSDTSLNQTAQAASDYLMTKSFIAAAQYQKYYLMPDTGINDHSGVRFEFRADQFNYMFINPDDMSRFGPGKMNVEVIDGSQFDPSVPVYWQMIQQVLNGKQGISDFGLTPQNSKDIPASSLAQMTQQADIPADHLKRRYFRALSRGHGALYDMICAVYGTRKARVRIGGGSDEVVEVRGDELPNFEFVVSDAPSFTGLEKARSEALDRLIAIPPEWQEVYADVNQLPRSVLRKVQKKQEELAAKAAMTTGPPPDNAGLDAPTTNGGGQPVAPGGPEDMARQIQALQAGPAMAAGQTM